MHHNLAEQLYPITQPETPRWYALSVYSRQEKAAQKELLKQGLEVFLPVATQRRLWSDRVKKLELALFPGYLFIHTHLDAQAHFRLLKPRQVIDLVGRKKDKTSLVAQYVPDSQIESLRLLIAQKECIEPCEHLVKGTIVKIVQGPLKGATGIIEGKSNGKDRLIVQIDLLGRGIRAELSSEDVWVAT